MNSWQERKRERAQLGLTVLKIKWPTPHATEALQSGVLFTSPAEKNVKLQTLQQGRLFTVRMSRNFIEAIFTPLAFKLLPSLICCSCYFWLIGLMSY